MLKTIRVIFKYIVPVTILGIFLFYSYSVQSELQKKEEQTYISLKELSELAEKTSGVQLSFLDKSMITIMDWIIPGSFINKNESLKLLAEHQNKITYTSKKIFIAANKIGEVVVTKKFSFDSPANKEPKQFPMGTVFSAFVISPFHVSENANLLHLKLNINSISCTAISDSILEADYTSGTIAAKISSIKCSNDESKSIPLDAVALVSGLVITPRNS